MKQLEKEKLLDDFYKSFQKEKNKNLKLFKKLKNEFFEKKRSEKEKINIILNWKPEYINNIFNDKKLTNEQKKLKFDSIYEAIFDTIKDLTQYTFDNDLFFIFKNNTDINFFDENFVKVIRIFIKIGGFL